MKLIIILWYTSEIFKQIFNNFLTKDDIILLSWRRSKKLILKVIKNYFKHKKNQVEFVYIINFIWCPWYDLFLDFKITKFKKVYECNLFKPLFLIQFLLKKLLKFNVKINIININSQSWLNPFYYWSAYCSSKAALSMTLKVIQKEYKIKIYELYPWYLPTRFNKDIPYIPKKQTSFEEIFREIKKIIWI